MEKKKMKLWKKILIIIAILLIIFIIIVSRKVLILNSLNDKISKYENSTNAYSKVTTNLEDSKLEQMESFLKDDVIKTIAKFKNADNLDSTVIQFEYPDVMKTYIEDGDKKTFSSYKNEVIERNIIINYASYNNIFELIYNSIVSRIYTDTLDEKECYVIESTANSNFLYGEDVINVKVYIEKDTGLCLKMVEVYDKNNEIKEYETLREYKFDSITDEDMKEPDISEYTIIQ